MIWYLFSPPEKSSPVLTKTIRSRRNRATQNFEPSRQEVKIDVWQYLKHIVMGLNAHFNGFMDNPDCALSPIQIKNLFEHGNFLIVHEGEFFQDSDQLGYVFSCKPKTDSQGNEIQCKAQINANSRFYWNNTYIKTFAPTSRFNNVCTSSQK